ncbi:shikimate kinase [Variovorax sp. J22P168]|uniref:shikimate kinase n=1 Tax=Variovorax jilinensis TaxID=3053513 RepID=UPI002574FB3D|nr:shikimate kinase [Variovorax sp. J22P168]MDM0011128.1 shikimate kinase [Variovorax sp. J22P168]
MTRLLHLVGPGGAGKTTVGPVLARRLGWSFIDLDERFLGRHGDIAGCIETHGHARYARRNLALYFDIQRSLATPAVLALFLRQTHVRARRRAFGVHDARISNTSPLVGVAFS